MVKKGMIITCLAFFTILTFLAYSVEAGANIDVIYPPGDIEVIKDEFFNVTINVTCVDVNCGDMNSSVWYNVSQQTGYGESNDLERISEIVGDTPFYTNVSNPFNYNLNQGQSTEIIWYINATGPVGSTHRLSASAWDTSESFDTANFSDEWTVTITDADTTPPNITIHEPQNQSYSESTLDLNVSADKTIDTWWYNLNGTNVTFTPNTTIEAEEGSNNLTVYANDSSGNVGSENVTFTIDTIAPVLTIHSPIVGLETDYNFELNFSSNESVTAKYSFDGGETNKTITSDDGLNFFKWIGSTEAEYNDVTLTVWVEDGAGNIDSESVDFEIRKQDLDEGDEETGGGGGGSSSGTATTLTLSNIEMEVDDEWIIGNLNNVRVETFELGGENIDVNEIDIYVKQAVELSSNNIIRAETGTYDKSFEILDEDADSITIVAEASLEGEEVSVEKSVKLVKVEGFDKFKNSVQNNSESFLRKILPFLMRYWIPICSLLLLLLLLIAIEIIRRNTDTEKKPY